jgi:hypothetical protein
MRLAQDPLPQCLYTPSDGQIAGRCEAPARYLVLAPPLAFTLTPTPVWLEGEDPQALKVRKRGEPVYCRTHAYLVCGLDEGRTVG